MKIAITGGAGFIASHISDAFLAAGHELLVIDDLSSGRREQVPAAARFVHADIRSPEAAKALLDFRPDVLDHHAAQIDVRKSVEDPRSDNDVNVGGFLNLLEAARKAGTRRVVFASSGGAMYGDDDPHPSSEEHLARPISAYGIAKRSGELYLDMYRALYGIHTVALRYANVYGPRQSSVGEAGVVAIFASRALNGGPVTIYGDGGQTRDFVFVEDVARANLAALSTSHQGAINIGTGVETDVKQLWSAVATAAKAKQTPSHAEPRLGEVRRSSLDPSLAAKVLDWRATVPLELGVRRTVDWFRSR